MLSKDKSEGRLILLSNDISREMYLVSYVRITRFRWRSPPGLSLVIHASFIVSC